MNRRNSSRFRILSYFTLAVAVIVVWFLISNLGSIAGGIGWFFRVISPFIYGFIIAYLLSIPCTAMQRLFEKSKIKFLVKFKKGISIALIYLIFIVLIVMTLWLVLPRLFFSIVNLVDQLPAHYQQLEEFIANLNARQLPFNIDLEAFFMSLAGEYSDITSPLDIITNFISYDRLASYLSTIFFGGAAILFRWILAFISSIYFLFEMKNLGNFIKRMLNAFLKENASRVILEYGSKVNQYFKKYIFCLIMDCIFMLVAGTLILVILRSPYALVLGLLLGVMNFIPYFGSIIATLVAIIVVLVTQGFTVGLIGAILLLVVQQLDANFVQPRLYGTGLRLSPLLVIISVSLGGSIGGAIGGAVGGTIMGMIVAIPVAKVFMNIVEDLVAYREQKKLPPREGATE
ncbi:MAG: AI-2E family transporter [Oscillospiraceae bacterium]|nr:AI-2E family transporter [Oscillospiraceae bacterium]